MADVTLRQGIEGMLNQYIPEVKGVVDITDHTSGANPYYEAAKKYEPTEGKAELVRVYEKIRPGWVYNGLFKLVDSWLEESNGRSVFKFRLEVTGGEPSSSEGVLPLDHNRLIPKNVMLEVWKRDRGRCVMCGSDENLHFDHIIPYSKGGTSTDVQNIRLLCARHNMLKGDRIE